MSLFSIFTRTIKISFYYSYKDERLRKNLEPHFSSLKQQDRVKIDWYKCQSVAGRNSKQANYRYLNTYHVIVLLVSSDFMEDDGWEIGRRAMKLYNAGKARVVPVKLRHIDNWEAKPFKDQQYLPSNGEPVTSRVWINHDEAFENIAQGIRVVVEDLEQEQRQRQFTIAEQAAIFAPINSFISNQFFQKIIRSPNISTRSVPILAGVLVVAGVMGFNNFFQKNQAESAFNQGEQKRVKRDYVGAVKDYTQAIKIDPNYADAYSGRGYARSYLKDYKVAIEDYTRVIHIDPKLAEAYMNRAVVRCKLKDKQGAIKDDQEAVTLSAKQGAKEQHNEALNRLQLHRGSQSCSSN